MAIDRKAQRPAAPDRDANPIVPWLHGLAAKGDERWHEAIPALLRFLEMAGESENRVARLSQPIRVLSGVGAFRRGADRAG